MTGRLATVQPALRIITFLPEGETEILELALAPDAKIIQLDREHLDRELTLPALVLEIGSRVVIDYRVEDGRAIVARITVEASGRAA
jgi:hypothetical protein